MSNQLKNAFSPYLLQHANNPVYWKFWNDENLISAQNQNKLLIISIGYSACHWCHVMEHECFEDREVADVMNNFFTSFKIDREELPAIDAYYMQALQLMTNHGGWPLNIVALPNGKPVWGGTYVPKSQWIDVLLQLNELYQTNPDKMIEYADKLQQGIALANNTLEIYPETSNTFNIDPLLNNWIKSFDWQYGGYIKVPKFMMPTNLNFLYYYGLKFNHSILTDFVTLTLTKMAYGGLFDAIEGGFSRYSVDHKWHIPHFEKMLYDNAQLLTIYSKAYIQTQNLFYKEVVTKTVNFILNNWQSNNGGFFSAYDADSLNSKNQLQEGAYYFWTENELKEMIPIDEWNLFKEVFSINKYGYWDEAEAYVLIQEFDLENIANENKLNVDDLRSLKSKWETVLIKQKRNRNKPLLDDKIITSWNAMLLSSLLDASLIIESSNVDDAINKLSNYLQFVVYNDKLGRVFKNNQVYISGSLEDYAFTIKSFLQLFQHTQQINYLTFAKQLLYQCMDEFYDVQQGYFKSSDSELVGTVFDIEDNVIPSSNALMSENLFLIGVMYKNECFLQLSQQMINRVVNQIQYASGYSQWLFNYYNLFQNFEYIVINDATITEIKEILQKDKYSLVLNNKINIPILDGYKNQNKKYQVCNLNSCRLLTDNIKEITN